MQYITYQKGTKVLKKFTVELNVHWMYESIFLVKTNKEKHIRKKLIPCLSSF